MYWWISKLILINKNLEKIDKILTNNGFDWIWWGELDRRGMTSHLTFNRMWCSFIYFSLIFFNFFLFLLLFFITWLGHWFDHVQLLFWVYLFWLLIIHDLNVYFKRSIFDFVKFYWFIIIFYWWILNLYSIFLECLWLCLNYYKI